MHEKVLFFMDLSICTFCCVYVCVCVSRVHTFIYNCVTAGFTVAHSVRHTYMYSISPSMGGGLLCVCVCDTLQDFT